MLSLSELQPILERGIDPDELKLVVGNTSYGVYNPYPLSKTDYYNPHYFLDISKMKELNYLEVNDFGISTLTIRFKICLHLLEQRHQQNLV